MSLSVLVDENVRWEGTGAKHRRVLVPPAPETLKSIRDLVAEVERDWEGVLGRRRFAELRALLVELNEGLSP